MRVQHVIRVGTSRLKNGPEGRRPRSSKRMKHVYADALDGEAEVSADAMEHRGVVCWYERRWQQCWFGERRVFCLYVVNISTV